MTFLSTDGGKNTAKIAHLKEEEEEEQQQQLGAILRLLVVSTHR